MKECRIKFKPTGIIFTLPEAEIKRIWKDDHGHNYELVDGDLNLEKEETIKITTTYEQVVEDETVRSFYDYTTVELKEFCKENGLSTSGNKAVLLERCLEFTQQMADEQVIEEVEQVVEEV